MPDRILYVGPLSLYSRKAEIALREKALAFEQVLVPFTQAQGYQPKHPVVIAANPLKRVPVLVEGDLTLFDSTVIMEYLEDAYPEPPLYPRDPKAKALCRSQAKRQYAVEEHGLLSFTVSIGVTAFREGDSAASMVERADRALYSAKHAGRNRAVLAK